MTSRWDSRYNSTDRWTDGRRQRQTSMNTLRHLGILAAVWLLLAAPYASAQEERSPEDNFRKANDLFVQGEYREAVGLYKVAIEQRDDFKEAWYNLGAAYGQLRQYDKEKDAYRKALVLDPTYARAHYNLALALEDEGQYEEAVAEYKRTLEHEPEALDSLVNLGILLARIERLDEAIETYRKALALSADVPDIHYNLGIAFGKKAEKAEDTADREALIRKEVEAYEAALQKRPSFYKASYNLALAWHKLGDLLKEIEALERSVELKSRYPEALYNLAYAYEEAGELTKALDGWGRYVEIASRLESEKPFVEVAQKEMARIKAAIEKEKSE